MFSVVSAPPNFLWYVSSRGRRAPHPFCLLSRREEPTGLTWPHRQEYLEQAFPSTHPAPTNGAIAAASAGDDKALDRAPALVEPKLNIRNTVIKTLLDQTVGAAVNTVMYSMFMHPIRAAMAHHSPGYRFMFGGSKNLVNTAAVDWTHAVATSRAEFWPLVKASWAFWPFVSVLNFAVIKDVPTRNLVGSLAGVAWGVYVSLFA